MGEQLEDGLQSGENSPRLIYRENAGRRSVGPCRWAVRVRQITVGGCLTGARCPAGRFLLPRGSFCSHHGCFA